MYFYILDSHNIPQRDFERNQTELQSLLTEFKVSGEVARVTPLRLIADLVETAGNRGTKTLVVCGTDETFNQVLSAMKQQDFTLAFIPFVPDTQAGKILGMTDLETSIKTIASRRIEKIDVAKINDRLCLSYLELGVGKFTAKNRGFFSSLNAFSSKSFALKIRVDGSYTADIETPGGILVNTRSVSAPNKIGNPQDGFLDLLLLEKLGKFSALRYKSNLLRGTYENIPGSTVIRCKKIEFIEPVTAKVYINGMEFTKIPAKVEVLPQRFKIIVGKKRTF